MRTLPDYLRRGMKLIVIGCNPGDRSARVGHYYAGRGNQFWPLLYRSGVLPELLPYTDDKRLIEFGVGLTDLVKRATRGIEDLDRQDFAEGRILLAQKLEEYAPRASPLTASTCSNNSPSARASSVCKRANFTVRKFLCCPRRAAKTPLEMGSSCAISVSSRRCCAACRTDATMTHRSIGRANAHFSGLSLRPCPSGAR